MYLTKLEGIHGNRLGYAYHAAEGKAARGFLEQVRNLPKDAKDIYLEMKK